MRLAGKWPSEPSEALYRAVRAAFVLRGSDLGAWCKANGVNHAWARQALLGARKGPAARVMRERILQHLKGSAS